MAKQLHLAEFWGKKRKNASAIWDHFGFSTNEKGTIVDKEKAVCKHCSAALKYQGGSTSNLQYHYSTYHLKAETLTSPKPSSQLSISQSFGQNKCYSPSSARHKLLQRSIAEYLIESLAPVSTVDSQAFVSLVKNLDPKFNVESRRTYADVILPKYYTDIRERVNNLMRPVEGVVCTTDGWTSIVTESYMTLTCHFIDKDWKMKSVCLQTRHHPESHTAQNLKEMLLEAFSEWKLDQKYITGVVDNARNIVNAWQLMDKPHMLCLGHTLNLAVKKGLATEGIGGVLTKCRKLVTHFNHSQLAKQALKSKQLQLGIPVKTLKQDVETRWNSTFDMIESILHSDEALSGVLRSDMKYNSLLLTPDDLATLKSVQQVLLPWKKLTLLMSAEQYPTLSLVVPSIQTLLNSMCLNAESDSELIKRLKKAMVDDLATRYQQENIRKLLLCASFLDPRMRSLDFITSKDNEDNHSPEEKQRLLDLEKKRVKTDVRKRMVEMDKKPQLSVIKCEASMPDEGAQSSLPTLAQDDNQSACSEPCDSQIPSKRIKTEQNFYDDFFSDIMVTKFESAPSAMDRAKQEMKLYQSLPVNTGDGGVSFNLLDWWKKYEPQLPMMSRLAKNILCVPATSTPSERLFSKAGLLINKKRASLKPSKVDMMLFLNFNYKL